MSLATDLDEPDFPGLADADLDQLASNESELEFENVDAFVREYLAPTYRRSLSGSSYCWCSEWWRHTEALCRLEALWRSWEYLRLDPTTGPSVWWRDHADPHMRALLSPDGPFKACAHGHKETLEALPTTPIPNEVFEILSGVLRS